MTIKRIITLQNSLILLCVAVGIMIGIKGYHIHQKISWLADANRLYAEKNLIDAETWYHKAQNNRSIRYKEQEISSRLAELAPITQIKEKLAALDLLGSIANDNQDFYEMLNVYGELTTVRASYMQKGNRYAPYYKEISAQYGISDDIIRYFQAFKTLFYEQMQQNLTNSDYSDESFKWNLLAIPELFYGNKDKKNAQLYSKFTSYDHTKLTRMASAGQFNNVLDTSLSMLSEYTSHSVTGDWVMDQAEAISRTIFQKDVEKENYAAFASHAIDYTTFVTRGNLDSDVLAEIKAQVLQWLNSAKRKISSAQFEQAIVIYEGLNAYHNTQEEISTAERAWTIHEPLRLLQAADSAHSYSHVISGSNRFGALIYVIAVDEQNTLYFGEMDSEGLVHIMSSSNIAQTMPIRDIRVDEQLSTAAAPVILVEGESFNRLASYSAFEVQTDRIATLLQIDADGYQIDDTGNLLLDNPNDEGSGHIAIYQRSGDSYTFVGIQQDYTNIAADNLIGYRGEKVQFSTYVTQPGTLSAYAEMGYDYVKLIGNFDFSEGPITVVGTFNMYEDLYVNDELTSTPVFEVESIE
ncbi:hypothetical protein J2T13_003461 [Paenibacillus sp. DS2015]|uniref:hypothetical protein n=1 Tax=Paenibacillus sp. DS2015 TaxID=3373917 RepID=UPI003D2299EC